MRSTRTVLHNPVLLLALFFGSATTHSSDISPRSPGDAAGHVVLMSTDAIITSVEAVRAQAQSAIGKRIAIRWGSARGDLKDAILGG